MARIAFIGAGSLGFTRGLVRDILTFPLLEDSTLVLMDTSRERLRFPFRPRRSPLYSCRGIPSTRPARRPSRPKSTARHAGRFPLIQPLRGSNLPQSEKKIRIVSARLAGG